MNKTLPYLVSNVVELLELEELQEEEGANVDLDAHKTKCAVIKTSTRATYFLPVVGLVDSSELKPGDLVGVNKVSLLVQKRTIFCLTVLLTKVFRTLIWCLKSYRPNTILG